MDMTKKPEKVVEELTALSDSIRRRVEDADDAYGFVSINVKYWQTITHAIALLQAQESVAVIEVNTFSPECRTGYCPKCRTRIVAPYNKYYCGKCGQAVKWI